MRSPGVKHGLLTVFAVVAEPFTHCTTREGSKILQGGSFRGRSCNDDRVLHSIVLLEGLDELRNSRALLANGDIDTIKLLILLLTLVPAPLVEDGVNGNSRLACLTVTDDKFTLATTDRHHCIDGFNASHHGLVHGATGENSGSLQRGTTALGGLNRALAVDGVTERIDDTTE